MIGFLKGRVISRDEESEIITLLVGQVGYEVRLPHIVYRGLEIHRMSLENETDLELFIYQHQTERTPKPLLIGFRNEVEREFFTKLISVQDIGPTAAAKALTMPIRTIARAIEERDITTLTKLSGIGKTKAEKIAATLAGKVAKFALMQVEERELPEAVPTDELRAQVIEVLTSQLGYKRSEAVAMVDEVLTENPGIQTPEELFDAVYRARR
ncbi:Holliday junction DNA helicase RuvA [candidate division TA06 bacterium B3_TA06]|uniref:Holliday junction branch migration complex subunit RuvA n=1 Tax=candidate division TA06 bacterium B3_TA06 TaxID=2012487 RepID=A0A532V883_UNCT6|nr:MAG: Holliday junction DNA helicase RuvA [candidate division TA06 bacterium B3_TA06]